MTPVTREFLEELYSRYNHREFVHPDPLEFVYEYDGTGDREVAALVASTLAYGKVSIINKSVRSLLDRMGPSPAEFLMCSSMQDLSSAFAGFKHRRTTGEDMAVILDGARRAIEHHGSLNGLFLSGMRDDDETVLPALAGFALALAGPGGCDFHVPSPEKGSACKRLNLFLRWMVRRDRVDPGCWTGVPPSRLVVPLDTHMFSICRALALTRRRQAGMSAALEITSAFGEYSPEDPVKYDFAITRLGMHDPGFFDRIDLSHC